MIPLLTSILVASLLGSVHCAGMCGGFVGWYSAADSSRAVRLGTHVGYHMGRLFTYSLLGLVAGFIGGAIDFGGGWVGVQHAAAIGAGAMMLVWGLARLFGGGRGFSTRIPDRARRAVGAALRVVGDAPPVLRAFSVGLLTTWLPCGWLYAFVLAAGGTGHALAGFAVMFAFWLGTVPILFVLGIGVGSLSAPLRRHLPRATAAALVIVGIALILGRGPVVAAPSEGAEPAAAAGAVVVPDPSAPCPCGDAGAR